jgi:hypothetical protein
MPVPLVLLARPMTPVTILLAAIRLVILQTVLSMNMCLAMPVPLVLLARPMSPAMMLLVPIQLVLHVRQANTQPLALPRVPIVLLVHMMTIPMPPLPVKIVLREPHQPLPRHHVVLLAPRESMQPRALPHVPTVLLVHMMTIPIPPLPVQIVRAVNHHTRAQLHVLSVNNNVLMGRVKVEHLWYILMLTVKQHVGCNVNCIRVVLHSTIQLYHEVILVAFMVSIHQE